LEKEEAGKSGRVKRQNQKKGKRKLSGQKHRIFLVSASSEGEAQSGSQGCEKSVNLARKKKGKYPRQL